MACVLKLCISIKRRQMVSDNMMKIKRPKSTVGKPNFSKEWLDYAKASGQDTKAPMSLCVSATQGDAGICK